MAKSKYKLQPVLDARGRAKQDAALYLAACRAKSGEAESELARREAAVTECRAAQQHAQTMMMQQAMQGTLARNVVAHRTRLHDLRQTESELLALVEQQRRVLERAEAEVERAVAALIEASKEVQVIEKHQESWQGQTRREAARREGKLNDEIAAILHRRHSSG